VIAGEGSMSVSSPVIAQAPVIASGLAATTNFTSGSPVNLAVTLATAYPALVIAWSTSLNGQSFTPVAGATAPSLTLSASQALAVRYVKVTVANALGSAVSTTQLSPHAVVTAISAVTSSLVPKYGQSVTISAGVSDPKKVKVKIGSVTFKNGALSLPGCTALPLNGK
jgi:hypothetical protein